MKEGSRTGRDEPTKNEGRVLNETEAHRKPAGGPDHGARPVDIIENPRPGLIEDTWPFSFLSVSCTDNGSNCCPQQTKLGRRKRENMVGLTVDRAL